jgi:hypothetical protein
MALVTEIKTTISPCYWKTKTGARTGTLEYPMGLECQSQGTELNGGRVFSVNTRRDTQMVGSR